jgi:hypothetical protein
MKSFFSQLAWHKGLVFVPSTTPTMNVNESVSSQDGCWFWLDSDKTLDIGVKEAYGRIQLEVGLGHGGDPEGLRVPMGLRSV